MLVDILPKVVLAMVRITLRASTRHTERGLLKEKIRHPPVQLLLGPRFHPPSAFPSDNEG